FVMAYVDTVIGDGDGAGDLVEADPDSQFGVALIQSLILQRLEAQLVGGVGGVGDQLAQEDIPVAVEGVNHQVQKLLHLGLELQSLFVRLLRHTVETPRTSRSAGLGSRRSSWRKSTTVLRQPCADGLC